MVVVPLVCELDVVGVFELVADEISAFEERDVATLIRLKEMILTAVEHADAARRPLPEISEPPSLVASHEEEPQPVEAPQPELTDQEMLSSAIEESAPVSAEIAQIGSCEACGFPVSQGRTLCVDCERAGRSADSQPRGGDSSAFSHLTAMGQEETWLQAHSYTLGALFIAALTIALLALKLR